MKFPSSNGYFKQTALQVLCGLLPCLCFAQQRNISDATRIANHFVQGNLINLYKSGISLKASSSIISAGDEAKSDKDAYYVFTSTSDEAGFVIVSGDERMPDVLAYSEFGSFNVDSIPSNVLYWLDCYKEAFISLNNDKTNESKPLESVNPEGVAPLLGSTAWGQGDPYNRLCPSVKNDMCVTGCVATGMAQVMKYHGYPDTGKGEIDYYTATNHIHLQKDFSSVRFQWNKMLNTYKNNFTQEEANSVAELMSACGASVKMDYCTGEQGGSGAYQADLITAFVNYFNYDTNAALMDRRYCSIEDWHQILINELNAGRPVNYGGQSMRDGGHSFVFDGYKVNTGNNYPYYHVNWGWNGDCDGYYQIADLHPMENGQYATYAGFNSSQQMTIGIKPEDNMEDSVIYLCTPNLYISSSTIKAGNSIRVYTASCLNFSYKPFDGKISVALISQEDGTEIILGESRMKTLGYLEGQDNLSIDITTPSTIAAGQYMIQFLCKPSGANAYQKVLSKKYPTLTISSTGEVTPEKSNDILLGCSELEAISSSDPSLVCLNIYEIQNLMDYPFIGDLKMILADKIGKQLCSFGDSIQPGELSTFEVQEEPLKIQGKLIGEWTDGDYKLYVGARQINTSKFVYLSFYDITRPDLAYQDLSLNAEIMDNRLIVNGKSYIITPTSIKHIETESHIEEDDNINFYCVDGRFVGKSYKDTISLPPGIYIVRQGKSTRKMVIR